LSVGDPGNPDYYRGITLVSSVGKVFTSILNSRLTKYADLVEKIPNAHLWDDYTYCQYLWDDNTYCPYLWDDYTYCPYLWDDYTYCPYLWDD
jgi:hypothetical protein